MARPLRPAALLLWLVAHPCAPAGRRGAPSLEQRRLAVGERRRQFVRRLVGSAERGEAQLRCSTRNGRRRPRHRRGGVGEMLYLSIESLDEQPSCEPPPADAVSPRVDAQSGQGRERGPVLDRRGGRGAGALRASLRAPRDQLRSAARVPPHPEDPCARGRRTCVDRVASRGNCDIPALPIAEALACRIGNG